VVVKFIYVPVVPKFILNPDKNVVLITGLVAKFGNDYPGGFGIICVMLRLLFVLFTKLPLVTKYIYLVYMLKVDNL
jgi:hypothetical protein